MIKKILLGLLVLLVMAVASGFAYVLHNKSPQIFEQSAAGLYQTEIPKIDQDSLRTIDSGDVIGFSDSYNTHAWLGIPYASPPLEELRWRAPQSVKAWDTRFEATQYGDPCIQFWGAMAGADGEEGQVVGNEDCLSLNVWAPKSAINSSKKLPVMYWIHGGGNDSGTGMVYQGHHLAGEKDVIVVTINYRVGMFGWFSHDAIRATSGTPEDASGNYGTLDIIQGLKWVNENIAAFGGDPNNVTIFGESAGGRNVYSLLVSPLAKGLFHKAISQSGTPNTTTLTLAEDFDDDKLINPVFGLKNSSNGLIYLVLNQMNPSESEFQIRTRIANMTPHKLMSIMRDVSPVHLMTLASDNSSAKGYINVARVLRDGYVLPKESTLDIFNDPRKYNHVPLILGTNRDEQKLFMARDPKYVDMLLGVLPRLKDEARYNRISEYVSDHWKAGAVDEPAKIISKTQAPPVYAYRFDWDESPSNIIADLPTLYGAAHGLEINFVFGDFEGGVPLGLLVNKDNAPGRAALSASMMDYWAQFAHTGNPSNGRSGLQVEWSSWKEAGHNIMLFDTLAGGGVHMAEVRNNVVDIKAQLPKDNIFYDQRDRCEAYAALFLHGYQSSDFWNPDEYSKLGCDAFPAGEFRNS